MGIIMTMLMSEYHHNPESAAEQYREVEEELRNFINECKNRHNDPEVDKYFESEKYKLVKHVINRDEQSGIYSKFEQFDGSTVEILRQEKNGLIYVEDIIFSDYTDSKKVALSPFFPEGYRLLEGVAPGRECMVPRTATMNGFIILQNNFAITSTGRAVAAHELGHAIDCEINPIQANEPSLNKQRERSAWKEARKLMESLHKAGIGWLPEKFEREELKPFVSFSIESCSMALGERQKPFRPE